MHEAFDPYHQWLGRTTSVRPLNHYQLLDLPDFEEDRERIENAGMIELAKVLRHDSGPQALAARRLCEEVAQAVNTLCDGPKKEAYDAELRRQRGGSLPSQPDSPRAALRAECIATSPNQRSAIARPPLPRIPVKPLVKVVCALGLVWSGLNLWNLGGKEHQPPPAPTVQRGAIDPTLPAALREKQTALKEMLDYLEQGTPYSKLKELLPGVRLTESAQDFYRDVVGLERWEFNGKPQGNEVPVVLYMSEDKPGNPEKRVERVYAVSGSLGHIDIARKN